VELDDKYLAVVIPSLHQQNCKYKSIEKAKQKTKRNNPSKTYSMKEIKAGCFLFSVCFYIHMY
jgi:hypothetical protein